MELTSFSTKIFVLSNSHMDFPDKQDDWIGKIFFVSAFILIAEKESWKDLYNCMQQHYYTVLNSVQYHEQHIPSS